MRANGGVGQLSWGACVRRGVCVWRGSSLRCALNFAFAGLADDEVSCVVSSKSRVKKGNVFKREMSLLVVAALLKKSRPNFER